MRILLVGAGGHARALVEILRRQGHEIAVYCAPVPSAWLPDVPHVADDGAARGLSLDALVMGLGGTDPAALQGRLDLLLAYLSDGWQAPAIRHGAATIAEDAVLGPAATVLAGAIVQPAAKIAEGAIVNSGAIVEHDSEIGAGSHVAPGAIVLGGARVGSAALIGAGAVVLPGARVPDRGLVPALARVPA